MRSSADAVGWCESEHANLVAAVHLAHTSGLGPLTWQLPGALWSFFQLQRHLDSWIRTHEIALSTTFECEDRTGQAMVRNNLSIALIEAGRHQEALEHLEACVSIRLALADELGAAAALNNMGAAAMEAACPIRPSNVCSDHGLSTRQPGTRAARRTFTRTWGTSTCSWAGSRRDLRVPGGPAALPEHGSREQRPGRDPDHAVQGAPSGG